jgi:hypothetical protein
MYVCERLCHEGKNKKLAGHTVRLVGRAVEGETAANPLSRRRCRTAQLQLRHSTAQHSTAQHCTAKRWVCGQCCSRRAAASLPSGCSCRTAQHIVIGFWAVL